MKKIRRDRGLIFLTAVAIAGILLSSLGKSLIAAQTPRNSDAGVIAYRIPQSTANIAALRLHLADMTPASVQRIIDGDTIVAEFAPETGFTKPEKIRLIGVDTPETVDPRRPVERFGKEASKYAEDRLLGKTVYLAFEQKLRDNYGRLLAYVFLEDGACVNLDIVADGFGFAYTKYPFYFMDDFRNAEKKARSGKLGLWGDS